MTLIIAILGLCLGSFLNVVIHRLPLKESLVSPGSHCPQCGQAVRWYDNVPVLGWLMLKGRCRDCGASISVRYPIIEALTALGLTGLYIRFGLTHDFGQAAVLFLFLLPISAIDWDRKLILNRLTLPAAVIGVIYILLVDISKWKTMLLGIAAAVVVLLAFALLGRLLFKKEAMGMGDVKLLAVTGIYLGFPQVLYGLFLGMTMAAIFILGGLIMNRLDRKSLIPFGPFIAIGALGQLLCGDSIIQWYIGLYQ